MSPTPTIRDLADKLGLGKSTIQRALADRPGISEKTRKRVREAADTLGYRPDPFFSSLALQRSRMRQHTQEIVYLRSPDSRAGKDVFDKIQSFATALGYNAHCIDPDMLGAGHRLMEVLFHRGYVGVIVGPVLPSFHDALLANAHLPVVCCGRIDQLPLHTVQPDITEIVRSSWRRMIDAGYRRIGPAITQHAPAIDDDFDRLGTILACQQELPPRDRIPPLLTSLKDREALVEWFNRHKPDAVLGFAVNQYHVLKENGVDVDRIGFVSMHTAKDKFSCHISGMEESKELIPRESVHLLDQLIRTRTVGRPTDPLHLLIPGRWTDGTSLPPRAQLNR